MDNPKLTETAAVRMTEQDRQDMGDVCRQLEWSEGQVLRWCLQKALPKLRERAEKLDLS